MTNQTNALNQLKSVIEISALKYAREIDQKTKLFNEFQIFMIKKDSANVETLLHKIPKRKIEAKEPINDTKK